MKQLISISKRAMLVLLGMGISWSGLQAQDAEASLWDRISDEFKIQPVVGIQIWSTYTHNAEVYDEVDGVYLPVDNRFNTHIRRGRFGLKGQPYPNLKFNFTTALDLVGRDLLAGTQGGGNNGSFPVLRVWNAYVMWRISQKTDLLHLSGGFMVPQIGLESITPALNVSSMEKAWSQNYLRRHLVGLGPGRSVGLNLGGLYYQEGSNIALKYDFGLFNPSFNEYSGNSGGRKYSPLATFRGVIQLGEPEATTYSLRHWDNFYGHRKGLSIGIYGSWQGETAFFERSTTIGADLLFNYHRWNMDGEWALMTRSNGETINGQTGYFRISWLSANRDRRVWEPVFMWTYFFGPLETIDQEAAQTVRSFAGQDQTFSLGLNYILNPKLKLSANYTFRQGDDGDASPGAVFNNHYFQSGVGPIHRGNWAGIGLIFML
jgi:hypothetical protein